MSQNLPIPAAEADVAAGGRGLATLNPHPTRAYEVTLKLRDAPGEFAAVEGVAQYGVVNEAECGHIEPATGMAARITSQEPLVLQRVADGEYRGTIYLDRLQDEDYYGRGVCRWAFSGAGALLKATGANDETRFLAFVEADRLLDAEASTRYYPRRDYPRAAAIAGQIRATALEDYPSRGRENRDEYLAELQGALFSISVSATEKTP